MMWWVCDDVAKLQTGGECSLLYECAHSIKYDWAKCCVDWWIMDVIMGGMKRHEQVLWANTYLHIDSSYITKTDSIMMGLALNIAVLLLWKLCQGYSYPLSNQAIRYDVDAHLCMYLSYVMGPNRIGPSWLGWRNQRQCTDICVTDIWMKTLRKIIDLKSVVGP